MANLDPQSALFTTAQVRALDQAAIGDGIAGIELMERAALAALAALQRRWPQARTLCVLCGPGNNGGDGFLLAALARAAGLQASVIALPGQPSGDAALARERFVGEGGEMSSVTETLPDADVYVDALFGSGLNRAPAGDAARLITAVNAQSRPVLALDVPSGLDSDLGVAFEPCLRATATVCFVGWKRGLFTANGPDQCGERSLATLDVPSHVHAIGGDLGAGGAVRMCGEAAARVGAGLVSIATREANVGPVLGGRPELMPHGVHVPRNLEPLLARASVLAIGPGLGQDDWGQGLWYAGLDAGKPTVLDADGLNLLAGGRRALPERVVLTPHP